MKAGDQIVTFRQDLARHAESGVVFQLQSGQRGEVVDMQPPFYQGSARVKFFDQPGEYLVLYEAICLAPGYASGDARRVDDRQPA